jgi:hypothetical protein
MRSVNGQDHIIYDGNDLGEGLRIVLSGDTIVFIREIQGKPHVIYNGEDFGIVDQGQDYQLAVSGKSVALERSINGKPHVFFNGVDQGEAVGGSVDVGESSLAFIRSVNGKERVMYKGEGYRRRQSHRGRFRYSCLLFEAGRRERDDVLS